MRAGKLTHRVHVQSRTTTPDAYGEPAQTWTTLHSNRAASIEPLSGREITAAQMVQSDITHRVRLRYVAGIEAKHRILFGTRVLDVRAVRNIDEGNRELELLCTEGVSAG